MHRDAMDDPNAAVADFWPLWYRKKFVDVVVPNAGGEWITEEGTDRSAAVPDDSDDAFDGTDEDTGGGHGRDAAAQEQHEKADSRVVSRWGGKGASWTGWSKCAGQRAAVG